MTVARVAIAITKHRDGIIEAIGTLRGRNRIVAASTTVQAGSAFASGNGCS